MSYDDEPLTLIHFFSPPPAAIERFAQNWPAITAPAEQVPGFRGIRLLRALAPEAPYPLIGLAGWDDTEAWETARTGVFSRFQAGHSGRAPAPSALYRVVHSTRRPTW